MQDEDSRVILCDLASAMGGERRADSLIATVLQRLLLHTGHQAGAYWALRQEAGDDQEACLRLHSIAGAPEMMAEVGSEIRLPRIMAEQEGTGDDIAAHLPHGMNRMHAAWLPVPGEGLLLLCSQRPPDERAWSLAMLRPAMRDFANALQQSRDSGSLLAGLDNLLASIPDGIILTDSHGIMLTVNRHTETMFGYPSQVLIGNTVEMLLPQFSRLLKASHAKAEAEPTGETKPSIGRRLTVRRQNGEFFPVSISVSPVSIEGMDDIMISIRDMTEYENLANQFQQAQKMEALGTLVGGVSHDFNNLLTLIAASALMAKQAIGDNASAVEKIRQIEHQCASAQEMIGALLAFSRKEETQHKRFSLTTLMRDSLKLYATAIPSGVELDVELADEALMISGSPNQIQQVVLNLLNNARDALAKAPEKHIRISLQALAVDALMQERNPMFTADRYAQLTLADTGHGIPHHVIKKVFEPFFTTKPASRGTGLGLSMVYSTVEAHQGIIEVESQEGKGTSFRIFLPLV